MYKRQGHEFWECDFAPPEAGLYWYRFELETCRGRMPLLKGEGGKGALSSGTFWQLTVYEKGFQTPGWLCGGIFYQIFPDRFYRPDGPVNNPFPDRTIREDWGGQPYCCLLYTSFRSFKEEASPQPEQPAPFLLGQFRVSISGRRP